MSFSLTSSRSVAEFVEKLGTRLARLAWQCANFLIANYATLVPYTPIEALMTLSLHHTAITTTRYSVLLEFYCRTLEGELVRETTWDVGQHELDARTGLQDSAGRVALLKFGSGFFEIFEFSNPKRKPSKPPILADTGLTHFALSCDDCFAQYERLMEAGMVFNAPPWRTPAGGVFTFGKDPDGNTIELIQPAPSSD